MSYYAKKRISYSKIMYFLSSGMSIRAIARTLSCSPGTINRKISTLARQYAVFMQILSKNIDLDEDLVADGFESFAVSQYFPNNFNILAGKDSQFVYHFNYVQLHRKGKMTDYQKKKAAILKKVWPLKGNHQYISFLEIKKVIVEMLFGSTRLADLSIYTDEKREYKYCLHNLKNVRCGDNRIIQIHHKRISSKKHRDLRNELFSVNYIDRELRKDLAEHHRETVCFARNVNSSVSRFSVYLLYHNFFKPYRINGSDSVNHADAAGIKSELYAGDLYRIFSRRFFLTHNNLTGNNERIWFRAYQTPLKWFSDYVPPYALAV